MNETKKMPVRIRESYMNITGNYPVWEWERRCRPRDGGGVCGRSGKYDYNKLSKKNRSLKRLIWDKNGQKPAWGKNSFIFQATYRPDGIRQRGSRVPAIRGFQRSFTQPRPGRDRRPGGPGPGEIKSPWRPGFPVRVTASTITGNGAIKEHPRGRPEGSGTADRTKERSRTPWCPQAHTPGSG